MSSLKIDDFFLIRTPRFPLDTLHALPRDAAGIEAFLLDWVKDPHIEEALYVASASLFTRMKKWTDGAPLDEKLTQSLIKYLIRVCARPTPFGLFSGVALGKFSDVTNLSCRGAGHDTRSARLDISVLSAMRDAARSPAIKYAPNASIHRAGETFYYIESCKTDGEHSYKLSSFAADEYIVRLLDYARDGVTVSALVDRFVAAYQEADRHEVLAFVIELVQQSILVADLALPLTGPSPERSLASALSGAGAVGLSAALMACTEQVNNMDARARVDIASYRAVESSLAAASISIEHGNVVQMDLNRGFRSCSIDSRALDQLLSIMPLMLPKAADGGSSVLADFSRRFMSKYGERSVPLLQALNEEIGLAFDSRGHRESSLLAGIPWRAGEAQATSGAAMTAMQEASVSAMTRYSGRDAAVVRLEHEVSQAGGADMSAAPYSFSLLVSMYEGEDGQPLVHFKGGFGPPASMLLGRFCGVDEDLLHLMRRHLAKEQEHSPDVVFAEIVHAPYGRAGNIVARPHLRDHEIVFLGDSSLPEGSRIMPDDLRVMVRNGEIILWSERLGRRIIPRLSCAHNYNATSPGIYKFLCSLAHQNLAVPRFSLPRVFEGARFVPRLMFGNVILQEMRWRVPRARLAALAGDCDAVGELRVLREEFRLDRYVTFGIGDNVLTIDLHNPAMVSVLLNETRNMREVVLKEALAAKFKPLVRDELQDARFCNEVVVPCINERAARYLPARGEDFSRRAAVGEFPPGSEWLSVKVYGAPGVVDDVLFRILAPLANDLVQSGVITKWFFIRYGDPDWHVRMRFEGDAGRLGGEVLPAIRTRINPELTSCVLSRLEVFTYAREVERYGGEEGILLAEQLFFEESRFLSGFLGAFDEDADFRWQVAFLGSLAILESFGFDVDKSARLIERVRDYFGGEFNDSRELRTGLGKKYRSLAVEGLARGFNENKTDRFGRYRSAIRSVAERYRQLESSGQLTCPIEDLVISFLHMYNNRVFVSDNRRHEFVIYDFLRRRLISDIARSGKARSVVH